MENRSMNKWPRDHTKVLFVAGRFRAKSMYDIEQNIRRAEDAALKLWRAGFVVICPHTNTRFFDGAAPDDIWLKGDREILKRCDGLVLIDSMDDLSEGVRGELEFALREGLAVCYDINILL